MLKKIAWLALMPVALSSLVGCADKGDGGTSGDPKSLEDRIFAGNEADAAERQQLIAKCMTEQGFEYTPMDTRAADSGPRAEVDTTSEEWVKEYGFGISTVFGGQIEFSPADDPNKEYRDSLDATQLEAYQKALYGQALPGGGEFSVAGGGGVIAVPINGGSGEDGAPAFEGPGGCIGEALKATGGATPFNGDLFDDLQELDDQVRADPKMVEAVKKWAACMKDAGYDYQDPDAVKKELREEFGDLTGLEISGDGGFSISGAVSSGVVIRGDGPDPEGGQAFDPLANVDKAKLAELQAKEKRIALAALDCYNKHARKTEQQVRERLETQFIEDHPELKDK